MFEENTIKITTNKTDFTLVALDKDAFPIISFEKIGNPIVLKSNILKKTIKQTNFAAGVSEARAILTGVCLLFLIFSLYLLILNLALIFWYVTQCK